MGSVGLLVLNPGLAEGCVVALEYTGWAGGRPARPRDLGSCVLRTSAWAHPESVSWRLEFGVRCAVPPCNPV